MMKLLVLLCAVAGAHAACTNCHVRVGVNGTCTDASNDLTCTAGSQRVAYTAGTATSKPLAAVAAAAGNVLNNHASTKTCVACAGDTLTCTAGAQGSDDQAGTVSTVCHHGFYKNSASPVRCVACNTRVGLLAAGYAANGTCTDANNDLTCAAGVDDVAPSETHGGSSFVVGKVLNNASARVCIDCKENTLECTADASTHTTAATTSTKCRRGYFVNSGACTACSTPAFTVSATTVAGGTHTITSASAQATRELRIAPGMRVIMSHGSGTDCGSIAATAGVTFTTTIASVTNANSFVVTDAFPTGAAESSPGHCAVSIEMATECTSATVDKAEGCAAGRNAAAATEYSLAVTAREGKVLNNHASPKCIWCKANALSCTAGTAGNDDSSDTTTTHCLNGFFKNSSGDCVACSSTAPVALTCSSNTVDLTCPAGVQSADLTTTKQAVSAVVGTILNNASNRKCINCKSNTLECTAGAQGSDATANTTSTKCHRGYYINSGACTACSVTATVCGADAAARLAAGLRPKSNVEACPTGEETAIPNTIATACVPCATGAAVCAAVGSSGVALADADDTGLATSCKSGFTAATGTCASYQFGTPPDFKVCTAVSTTSPAGAAAPGVFAALVAAVALALRM